MEQKKINIAEILKDCPKGMELDCLMYDNLYFNQIYDDDCLYKIGCYTIVDEIRTTVNFTEFGTFNNHLNSKCVIFPKGKTTWEGFVPPPQFKDGDIILKDYFIAIISSIGEKGLIRYHCLYDAKYKRCKLKNRYGIGYINDSSEIRLATEEEKQKLFDAIKANGYKWNAETKTLEKLVEPRFKVGNTIQDENGYKVKITEVNIEDECYGYESIIAKGIGGIAFKEQNNWELVPNKFDITTLKPFESRVLTRDNNSQKWFPAIWGYYDFDSHGYPHKLIGGVATRYCIPYESNEHLLGTTDDCDEFYKTW